MSPNPISDKLQQHRQQLSDHWATITKRLVTTDQAPWVLHACEHLKTPFAIPYFITGRVCAEIYAAIRHQTTWQITTHDLPTSAGIAIFDITRRLAKADAIFTGIQWGRINQDVWITPLTTGKEIGLRPARSLAPMTLGFNLTHGETITDDNSGEIPTMAAIAIAMWKRINTHNAQLIGPAQGSGVVINHLRR